MALIAERDANWPEAFARFSRVTEENPDHAEAHQHRGLTLLARGQFRDGWAEYAWRVKNNPTFFGRFIYPYWRGEPLAGRKILVWTELGPGDECLTATMIPDLIAYIASIDFVMADVDR